MNFATSHPGHAISLGIPVLETERLRLRAPSEADFESDVAFYASDRAAGVGGKCGRDEVWRHLAALIGHWVFRGYGYWAVEERATGTYCETVGLWCPEGWREPEIGWIMVAGAEGRGIAREAALAARAHAYDVLGWKTAISLIFADNHRSIALAERLGVAYDADYSHPSHGTMRIYRHPSPEALQ
jgi:RimJ/RimL family protein N-acetyltransferase